MFKNEAVGAEMIEILQTIQERYVPKTKRVHDDGTEVEEILDLIFIGGDQLSEEKARHAQGAMADGETKLERLAGLIPKNEDWHAIRYVYGVSTIFIQLITSC